MNPIDRRRFLAGSLRASAAAAAGLGGVVGGVVGGVADQGDTASAAPRRAEAAATGAARTREPDPLHLTPGHPGVNGLVDPVGVDPDDVSFAWTLTTSARGARGAGQRGYRITVHRDDPHHAGPVWDSGRVASAGQAFIPYAGPRLAGDAAYRWTVEVQDAAGAWSRPSPAGRFVTSLRQEDWTASWLRPAPDSSQPDRVTYLRSILTPPAGPLTRATATLAAAHTYQLFVDGQRVDLGPSFSYPDEQYARSIDLTSRIRPGQPTALGVLHRWYGAGQGRPASAPGLMLQLSLHYADGRRVVHGTDRTWREHPAEWLPSPLRNQDGADFVEWVDGRAHPAGWAEASYDDGAWSPATVLGAAGVAPFTRTFAQRTHTAEHVVAPVSLHTLANGSVVADFGAVYAARLRVDFAHGQDGRTVPMHVGYLRDPDGQVSTTHGTQESNLSFSYITRPGRQTFEALTYLGFRYAQIDRPGEPLRRHQIAAIATHTALPDVPAATFATGDRILNAVWSLNARSALYCSHGQFVDTPTREKGQFVWDAANESEAVMRAYGEQNLSWQGLRDVARGQTRYWPDGRVNAVYPNGDGARDYGTFTERYPEWLWRYYVATGDRRTAVLLYPSTRRVADYLWSTLDAATGLLTGLAEGSNGDPVYGYDLSVSADTVSNVLGINAFNRIEQLARLAGDDAGAAAMSTRAATLAATLNARLVRPDGIYVDGLKPDGTQSEHASQAANALALAYGVVPPDRVGAVGTYVAGLGIALGPNHGLELLRGLARAGLWAELVHTLTDTRIPGWAHIVAAGGTFTWETWTPSDLIGDSMSHGWGSSALVAMQESLLGVTLMPPDDGGAVQVDISPPPHGLGAARGTVPSIAGPIAVDWRRHGARLILGVTVPANATARLSLPAPSAESVHEGGRPLDRAPGIRLDSSRGGAVVVTVGSGTYRFTATRA
jgi:alpha-L-rhamnosidase